MIRSQDSDLTLTADFYITDQDEPDYPVVSEFFAWRFPEILLRVSIPFIYARFAYNIISIAQIMLSTRIFMLFSCCP